MTKTLVEPGRYDGNWWLPGAPETAKVPGTLIVGVDGALELQLIGSLRSVVDEGESTLDADGSVTTTITAESLFSSGSYPRILGESGASGYTLEDCFQTHRGGSIFGGLETQRIHVHQAFSRIHLGADDPLEFDAVVARLDGIQFWVSETGLGESIELTREDSSDENKVTGTTLVARNLDTKSIPGVSNSTVTIEHTYSIKGDRLTERGFTQHFNLRVAYPQPTALKELLNQVSVLQDLVTVAINRSAAIEQVTLRRADVFVDLGGKSYPTEIGLAARWVVNKDEMRPAHAHEVVFTLEEMGGVQVVAGWLVVSEMHRSALARVMTTRYSTASYVLDSLMNCAAAIEAYDRRKHGDSINYIERVKRCVDFVGSSFKDFVGDPNEWAKVLKDARNDVAHHLVGVDGASTKQILVARSAFWLFVMCLLKDAGAPDSLAMKILGHKDLLWLKDQLSGVMTP